jgi:DNA-binding PadR family transcriptional regulator
MREDFSGAPRRQRRPPAAPGRHRRGDVRHALLLLLADEPRNGYQLMQAIEERTGGRWRPSPGSVYPTLSQLEDEGLIHAIEQDDAKLFELTAAGRKRVAGSDAPPPWELHHGANGFHDFRAVVVELSAAARQVARVGDERQIERARETLARARRDLYRILAQDDR